MAQTVDTKLRTSTLAVGVQLSLGWNTYVLFNNILNFVWKTDEWEEESIALLIFVLWRCLNFRWMSGGRGGQTSPSMATSGQTHQDAEV